MGVKERLLWNDFYTKSSLHGLRHVFEEKLTLRRRFAWIVLLAFAVSYFCYLTVRSIQKYYRYETMVSIQTEYPAAIDVPEVFVCIRSPFTLSKVKADAQFITYFKALGQDPQTANRSDIYDFLSLKSKEPLPTFLNFSKNVLLTKGQLVKRCTYARKQKNCRGNDTHLPVLIRSSDLTFCFQLFDNQPHIHLTQEDIGKQQGLSVDLMVPKDDDIVPDLQRGRSVTLVVQRNGEAIELDQGIVVPVGLTLDGEIKIIKKELLSTEYPSSHCSNEKLSVYAKYSLVGCYHECTSKSTMTRCNCSDDLFLQGKGNACRSTDCQNMSEISKCKAACRESCNQLNYELSVSYRNYIDYSASNSRYLRSINRSDLIQNDSQAANYKFHKENSIGINLYLANLQYTLIKENMAYEVLELLGDIGGQMGLFIGASILTIWEIIDFLAVLFFQRLCYREKDKNVVKERLRANRRNVATLDVKNPNIYDPQRFSNFSIS